MELTVKDVFNQFGDKYIDMYNFSYDKLNIFNKIKTCRTSKQGVRIYKCSDCGKKIYTYRSCMDRHCPNCLDYKRELWLDKHKQDILNINYYHMVMIISRELYPLFYYNKSIMYDLFFKISSEIVMEENYK